MVVSIAAGVAKSAAVTSSGRLFCWGRDSGKGELGWWNAFGGLKQKALRRKAMERWQPSAVPGFGLEASQPMVGNFLGAPASWLRSGPGSAASSDLSALSGAAVRLQMEGRDFNLFSFWADCAPAP